MLVCPGISASGPIMASPEHLFVPPSGVVTELHDEGRGRDIRVWWWELWLESRQVSCGLSLVSYPRHWKPVSCLLPQLEVSAPAVAD